MLQVGDLLLGCQYYLRRRSIHTISKFLSCGFNSIAYITRCINLRAGISALGRAQRDLSVAWVKNIRGQLHQRIGRAVAVWRTDQGGHSAHPEMLNTLLPAQIHRLAGDGLRHGQAIVSQGRLCFTLKI